MVESQDEWVRLDSFSRDVCLVVSSSSAPAFQTRQARWDETGPSSSGQEFSVRFSLCTRGFLFLIPSSCSPALVSPLLSF